MIFRKFSIFKKITINTIYFLFIGAFHFGFSQNLILLDDKNEIAIKELPLIYQEAQELSIKEISAIEKSQFKPYNTIEFSPKNVYWAYFTLKNVDPNKSDYILDLGWRNSIVGVYYGQDGKFTSKFTGNYVGMSERDIPDSNEFAVNIHLPYDEEITVFVRFYNIDFTAPGLKMPKLINPETFYMGLAQEEMVQGVFLGLLWIMFFYNLFIFLYSRDMTYLSYSLFLACMSVYLFYFHGYTKKYLFQEQYWAEDYLWILSTGLASIFYYYFMRYFLNTKKLIPKIDVVIQAWIYIRLSILLVCLFVISTSYNTLLNPTTIVLGAAESLFGIFIFIKLLLTKSKLALFFVFGGFAFTILIFIGMFSYSFAPYLYIYLYEAGVTVEILAFSLGLGYRIKAINKQKREAQNELLQVQREMNQELEKKVEERTQLLLESNEELKQTVEELDITNQTLNEQNIYIHKQHKKIQSSIQYAKRIQEAMMPNKERLESVFSDSFVLFKPKDVVSGDFYWVSAPEHQTGKVVVAAVDCTGHGVPGAFMSLVGNAHLNQIVNNNHIYEPAEILKDLDAGIKKTLKQEETNNRDGMDISLCVYDPSNKKVTYAGAMNPIIYIQNGELQIIKGDRMFIGGNVNFGKSTGFKQHEIDVSIPTSIYIFSDGYQDQFGGPKNKKFMISRFKEQLKQIHELPCEEQEIELNETLHKWMTPQNHKAFPQIDDVMVIGMKI